MKLVKQFVCNRVFNYLKSISKIMNQENFSIKSYLRLFSKITKFTNENLHKSTLLYVNNELFSKAFFVAI